MNADLTPYRHACAAFQSQRVDLLRQPDHLADSRVVLSGHHPVAGCLKCSRALPLAPTTVSFVTTRVVAAIPKWLAAFRACWITASMLD